MSNVIDLSIRRLTGAAVMTLPKAPGPIAGAEDWPEYLRAIVANPPEGTPVEIVDALDRVATELESQIDALAALEEEKTEAEARATESENALLAYDDTDADDLYDALVDLGMMRRGGTLSDAVAELRWQISQTQCAAAHGASKGSRR